MDANSGSLAILFISFGELDLTLMNKVYSKICPEYPDKLNQMTFFLVAGAQNSQFGIDSSTVHSGTTFDYKIYYLFGRAMFFHVEI